MTPQFQFRYFETKDLNQLLQINLAFAYAIKRSDTVVANFNKARFEAEEIKHLTFNATCPFYRYYLCTLEDQIVGFIWFGQSDDDRAEGFIDELYVQPVHRRNGIATLLMKEALSWIKKQQCRSVTLLVDEQNDSAIQLYQRMGFRRKEGTGGIFGLSLV